MATSLSIHGERFAAVIKKDLSVICICIIGDSFENLNQSKYYNPSPHLLRSLFYKFTKIVYFIWFTYADIR